jgi:sulfatase modifying factor 1
VLITSVGRSEGKSHLANMLRSELSFIARHPYEVLHWRQLRGLEPHIEGDGIVLVDGPALLEGEEIFAIPPGWMERFDASLLVVLKRSTRSAELDEAAAWLRAAGAPPAGVVWNERDFPNYWTVLSRARDRVARLVDRGADVRSLPAPPPGVGAAAGEVTMSFAWRRHGAGQLPVPGEGDEPTVKLTGAEARGKLASVRLGGQATPAPEDEGFQWRRGDQPTLLSMPAQARPGDATEPVDGPPAVEEGGKRGRKARKAARAADRRRDPAQTADEQDALPAALVGTSAPDDVGAAPEKPGKARPTRRRSDHVVALGTVLVVAAGLAAAVLLLERPDPNDSLARLADAATEGQARDAGGAADQDATALLPLPDGLEPAPRGMVRLPAGAVRTGLQPKQRALALARCKLDLPAAAQAERCAEQLASEQPGEAAPIASFAISRLEVSQSAYRRCVEAGACEAPRTMWDDSARPVTGVTHAMAQSYCAWRVGGRLPTAAEWLYAARGVDDRLYPWGDAAPTDAGFHRANHGGAHLSGGAPDAADGFAQAAPTDAFPGGRSPFGLLNMAGNVREWTHDIVGGRAAVVGGGFNDPPFALRVTARLELPIEEYAADLGFRCVGVGAAVDGDGAGEGEAAGDGGAPPDPTDGGAP